MTGSRGGLDGDSSCGAPVKIQRHTPARGSGGSLYPIRVRKSLILFPRISVGRGLIQAPQTTQTPHE